MANRITDRRFGARIPIGATIGIGSIGVVAWEVNDNIVPVLLHNPLATTLLGVIGLLAAYAIVRR